MYKNLEKEIIKQIPKKVLPLEIFDNNIVNFLDNISLNLLKQKNNLKKYPDLISFAFWCRKNNIRKISKNYINLNYRLGRGIILHITPSNVPVNFAFSLAFGLLSGNHNIVRLPSTKFAQSDHIIKAINKALKNKKFNILKPYIKFIKYKRDENISKKISLNVDGRVIWGGDQTIKHFKFFETKPKCVDVSFPDRNSCSIINLNKFFKLKNEQMDNILRKLYTDTYTMDQNACSSPKLIFFIGKNKHIETFWSKFQNIVINNYKFDLSQANQKLLSLTKNIDLIKKNEKLNYDQFNLLKIKIKKDSYLRKLNTFNRGTFFEKKISKISDISKYVSEKTQTVTYFGVEKKEILFQIKKYGILGIDRIVPIGQAFDIGPVWDGHDLILKFSRIIDYN